MWDITWCLKHFKTLSHFCLCVLSCSLSSDKVRTLYWKGGAEANESTDVVFLSTTVSSALKSEVWFPASASDADYRSCFCRVFLCCRRWCSWTEAALCGRSCVPPLKEPCSFIRWWNQESQANQTERKDEHKVYQINLFTSSTQRLAVVSKLCTL